MKIVILAGGGGTRLFPLSRTSYPKQFLKLGSDKTLLTETVERYLNLVQPHDIIVVTNEEYLYHVKAELKECGADGVHILLEPVARNTAPAIALAARYCLDELAADTDEVMFVCPADHIIKPVDDFIEKVKETVKTAQNDKIVTLGVKPNRPETGYGYIKTGKPYKLGFVVDRFVEKPDKEKALEYLSDDNYFWNSGIYSFSIKTLMEEMEKYQKAIYEVLSNTSYSEFQAQFSNMPGISIDYAIAEKSSRVVTIPLGVYWNDIGSWDAIYEVVDTKDKKGNITIGDCFAIDCSDTLMIGDERMVAGIGLEDTIVVETDDVVVVAKKGESQKVKDLVEELKKRSRREAMEHTTGYRPWGYYTILAGGEGYKVKKIVIHPKQILSSQMHHYRSEHWIVINGTAKVTIGDEEKFVCENESIFVPKATKHRVENPGSLPLEIIEVQDGKYLEEDDIIRFDDIYGRT